MSSKTDRFIFKYNLTPHSEGERSDGKYEDSLYLELSPDESDRVTVSLFGLAAQVDIDMSVVETENFFAAVRAMEAMYKERREAYGTPDTGRPSL